MMSTVKIFTIGFTKRDDLGCFLQAIGGIDYPHRPDLTPTQRIMDAFKRSNGSWPDYERNFLALLWARKVETGVIPERLHEACLLCSEEKPLRY